MNVPKSELLVLATVSKYPKRSPHRDGSLRSRHTLIPAAAAGALFLATFCILHGVAGAALRLTPAAAARAGRPRRPGPAAWPGAACRSRLSCAQPRDLLCSSQCELTPARRGCASNQEGMNNFHQTSLYFMSSLCHVVCRKIHLMNTASEARRVAGARGQTPGAGPQPRMRRVCRRPRGRRTGRHAPPVRDGVMTRDRCGEHHAPIASAPDRVASAFSPHPRSP